MALISTVYQISTVPGELGQYSCYDGYSIWTTVIQSNAIVRLRASDGAYLKLDGTVGTLADATWVPGTQGLKWCMADPDGIHLWAMFQQNNISPTPMINRLIRYVISTGAADFTYYGDESGDWLGVHEEFTGVPAFDGTNIWVVAGKYWPVLGAPGYLYKFPISPSTETKYAAFNLPPIYMIFDGAYLWFNQQTAGLMKRSPSDPMTDLPLAHFLNNNASSITSDGTILWYQQLGGTPGILRMRVADGAYLRADLTVTTIASEAFTSFGDSDTLSYIMWEPVSNSVWRVNQSARVIQRYPYPAVNAGKESVSDYTFSPLVGMTGAAGPVWLPVSEASTSLGYLMEITYGGTPLFAQIATFPVTVNAEAPFAQTATLYATPPPPSHRYDLNIYGLSLDKVIGVQFLPYGPQFDLRQSVIIERINDEINEQGTLPFIIPYQTGEGVVTYFDVFGQNFDYVTGMQFVPYGPISGPPSPTPTGPPEPPTPLVVGEFQYWDPTHIGISQYDMPWYLNNGVFQRSTWYKLLLHCDEQAVEVDPTLVPSGPPVPATPLVPPDFALVTNQHIGIPYSVQQSLLGNNTLQYQTWYKFYLTYECGNVPPPTPTARAINPDQGWNWDEAYVITPDIWGAKIVDEFTTISPFVWTPYDNVTTSEYGMTLVSGPALGSWAGVNSVSEYAQGDWTIDFNIERYASSDTLPDTFTYVGLDYWMQAENWEVSITREYRPDVGHAYTATIYTPDGDLGGFVRTNSWRGSLRIIRYQNSITLLAKDYGAQRWQTVAYTRVAPKTGSGWIGIFNGNGNVPQIATALVERYISSPGVMFGLEPALYTNINPSTITLLVQPQLTDTVRFVDVATYTQDEVLRTTVDGFEYVRPHRFSLGGKPSIDWWIYRDVPTQPDVEQVNTHANPGTRLMNLTLTPTFGRYLVGQSVQYKVIAKFNDGSVRDITDACEWTTTDTYGTIQNGLMVFGTVTGTYFISATYQGLTQTATAYTSTVTRAAQTITLEDNDGVRFSGSSTLV